jgi:hypothetical protein
MATDFQVIVDKLGKLPAEKQRKVLDFVEQLEALPDAESRQPVPQAKSMWAAIEEITSQVPREAWAELPTDGSINVGHYLYGSPKE